jgi:hypothetical protein
MKQIRLWVEPPQEDETWLSFLSRSAQFYGLTRSELMTSLAGAGAWRYPDWDVWLPDQFRERALEAVGVEQHASPNLRGAMFTQRLPVCSRVAYCPHCAAHDLARHLTPYFRWQWSLPTTTMCHVHHVPLLVWPPSARSNVLRWPSEWLRNASTDSAFATRDWLLRDLDVVEALVCRPGYGEARQLLGRVQLPGIRKLESSQTGRVSVLSWPQHAFECVVTVLTAMPQDSEAPPLAQQLKPSDAPGWWMSDCPYPHRRRLVRNSLRAVMSSRHVGWRRTVLWLAARTIWGGTHRVELANGSVMECGNWSRAWDSVIAPLLPEQAREVAREARNVLQSQFPHFFCL